VVFILITFGMGLGSTEHPLKCVPNDSLGVKGPEYEADQ
jgi:hypothetical protein